MTKDFILIPKKNNGCIWFTSRENIFKTGLIEAVDSEGFETLVDINNYFIVK